MTFTLDADGIEPDGSDPTELPSSRTFTDTPLFAYTIAAATEPFGWELTDIVCDESTGLAPSTVHVADGHANLALNSGETITCTFTHTATPATLTVVVATDPADGPLIFNHYVGTGADISTGVFWSTAVLGDLGTETLTDRAQDTYWIGQAIEGAEPADGTWDLTDISCTDAAAAPYPAAVDLATSSVVLDLGWGEDVTCTFTDTARGTLTIVQQTLSDSATPQAFTYDTSFDYDGDEVAPDLAAFGLVNGASESVDLAPGSYTVTRQAEIGWDVIDIACSTPMGAVYAQRRRPGHRHRRHRTRPRRDRHLHVHGRAGLHHRPAR